MGRLRRHDGNVLDDILSILPNGDKSVWRRKRVVADLSAIPMALPGSAASIRLDQLCLERLETAQRRIPFAAKPLTTTQLVTETMCSGNDPLLLAVYQHSRRVCEVGRDMR